jgi:outer membrane receptor for ferrienterochelin and colicins
MNQAANQILARSVCCPTQGMQRRSAFGIVLLLLIAFACLSTPTYCQEQPPKDLTKLSIEDLMNVDVPTVYGASKFQQKITQAPAYVTIITSDEIQKYGYRTLADVLRSVPGFFVDYDRNYNSVGVRGFSRPSDNSNGLLLLIDGHRTNDNVYDSPSFGTEFILDVSLIKRVEIIRGPASALYGANSFFGVINIITKRGRDGKGAEITAEAASLGGYRAQASYGFDPLHGPEMLFSGTIYDSHGNQRLFYPEFNAPATDNGIAVDADRDKFYDLFANVGYRNFTVQAATQWREKGIPTAAFGSVFNDSRSQTIDWSSYLDLKYERTFLGGWHMLGHVSYDSADRDGTYVEDYAGTGIPPFSVNADHTRGKWWTVGLDVSRQLWEKHRVTFGTETRFNTQQNQSNNDVSPYHLYFNVRGSSTIPAFYVQDEYSIQKNLIFSAGLRYDHYATFGGSANPRVALIYSPWDDTSIKFLYGQAFRAPSQYELFLADFANLGPESIKTPEVVIEHYFAQHLRLNVSAFYNVISQLIIQVKEPDGGLLSVNQGDVHNKGLEFELAGKWPSGWEGRLAYTIQDSHNENVNNPVNSYPKHLPKINLIAPLIGRKVFASFEGQYVNERRTFSNAVVGGYFVSNATLFAPNIIRGLDLSLSAYNLLDRHYADPGSPGLTEAAIPQDGRTLQVKLTYRFAAKK